VALTFPLGPTLLAFETSAFPSARLSTLPTAGTPFPTPIRHVIVLMMEDQNPADVLAYGPYERYLAQNYAFATQYYGLTSDSVQNYEDAMSGSTTPGNISNQSPVVPITAFVDKLGLTWATYQESMPVPCDQQDTTYTVGNQSYVSYNIDHNPFVWYANITGNPAYCDSHVLNLSGWNTALAAGDLPSYVWVTPNDTNDDHSAECAAGGGPAVCIPHGDTWLRDFLGPFTNSSVFSSSVVFLTFDYNSTQHQTSGQKARVYFAALSPYAHLNYTSSVQYTPYDILTTSEWLLGIPSGKLNHNDNWTTDPPMYDLFHFPATYNLTFTGSGLSPGAHWRVTLNGSSQDTANSSLVFQEPNGTYPFNVSAPGYTASPTSGNITVYGTPLTESIKFTVIPPATYAVTFTEAGLPSGTNWSVTLYGALVHSITSNITFAEPNGTFSYTITGVSGWHQTTLPYSGTVAVHGAAVTEPTLAFTPNPSPSSGLSTLDYIVFGSVLVAVAVGVSLVLVRSRRKSRPDSPTSPSQPGEGDPLSPS